ncbi:MAG: PAS domain S-box protein [Bacteroidetes bacterium]|nr:PAS domain S-box protein [Bacteroidota bacterium]
MTDVLLTESEWRYRLISEVIADYIFVIKVEKDGNLKLDWVSENLVINTGRDLEEILTPVKWKTIIHPDDAGLLDDFIRQMLTTKEKGELECRSFHKEGNQRWIRIFARRSNGPDGKPARLIGAVREITDQKQTQQKLLRSEEKYRKLHSTMTDAFCSVNMNGEMQEFNESYRSLLGYSEEELLKLTYIDLTPEKWHEMEAGIVREEILPNGSSGVYEKEYIRKDGRIIPVEVRTFLIRDHEGTPAAMWAIVRDISERKSSEEKLRAALEEKETLLREAHHRVKNNLQTVMTLIGLRSPEIQDETSRGIIIQLQEQIRTISLIYQELFQAERLSRVAMQPYISQLLTHLLSTFHYLKDVKTDVDCGDTVLDAQSAMPCGLIVNELVTNALKYAFPRDFSQPAYISVSLRREGNACVLKVSDNGTGLPSSFDPDNPTSIGLSLVSLWAKGQMNGTLEIISLQGTTFVIRFNA